MLDGPGVGAQGRQIDVYVHSSAGGPEGALRIHPEEKSQVRSSKATSGGSTGMYDTYHVESDNILERYLKTG